MVETLVRPFRERVGDKVILNMHPGQRRAWDSPARFPVILAGTQGGKTVFLVEWLRREIATQGQGDYIAATATFPLLSLKLLPESLEVFRGYGEYKEAARVFYFKDGTRIIFASADNPESIESATAKGAICDEIGQRQFRREAWEAILRRLSLAQGRACLATTLYNYGWLKNEVYDRAKAGDKDYEVVQFASTLNPAFPKAEFERARATMPAWKFDMFYRGQFARPAGLVYDAFNEETCKVKRFPIPRTWPRYVGHDFGGANPAAMFYAQDLATGYFYAYQEYRPGPGRSTAEHVAEFKQMTAGMTVIKRAGGSHQEDEIRQGYTAQGWPIQEPKLRDVQAGIDRVYALHKLNKLFIFDDLMRYLDEKMSYSWKLNDRYEPTDEIEDKANYHLMDAERYILSDFSPETAVSSRPISKWGNRF